MTFNYRVLRELEWVHERAHEVFKVITVYYDEEGNITSWADTSDNSLVWGTYEDLAGTAEYIMQAFKRPVLKREADDKLVPMSAEPEPAPKKEFYVVEYRDHDKNASPVYYASSWRNAVKFLQSQDNGTYKNDFFYAITTQHLDEVADDLAEAALFDKDGELMGEGSE